MKTRNLLAIALLAAAPLYTAQAADRNTGIDGEVRVGPSGAGAGRRAAATVRR